MGQSMNPLGRLINLRLELVGEIVEDIVDFLFDIVPAELELANGLVDETVGVMDDRVERSGGWGCGGEEEGRGCEREDASDGQFLGQTHGEGASWL